MPGSSGDEAIAVLRERILSIPADLKALFAVVDDADLPDELRVKAAAAIFYNLNPSNLIPAKEGMLGYADDALAIRCAMFAVAEAAPEQAKRHAEHAPELWGDLDRDIAAFSGLLGDLWEPFREAWLRVGMMEWRGKKAADAVADEEVSAWLYAAVDEAFALRDLEEAAVVREVRRDPLLAKLQGRLGARKRA